MFVLLRLAMGIILQRRGEEVQVVLKNFWVEAHLHHHGQDCL